jgi:hypothetical protein
MKFFTRLFQRTPTTKSDRASLLAAIRTAIGNALNATAVHPRDIAEILEARAMTIRVGLSGAAFAQPKPLIVGQPRRFWK